MLQKLRKSVNFIDVLIQRQHELLNYVTYCFNSLQAKRVEKITLSRSSFLASLQKENEAILQLT